MRFGPSRLCFLIASQCRIASCNFSRSTSTHWPRTRVNPVAARQQRLQLLRRQRLVSERHSHIEIQHGLHAERGLFLRADGHRDPRARPPLPPVGQPHRQTALFQVRNREQESLGQVRRPCQRLIDLPRIDQFPHPVAARGGLLDRSEQVYQRGPIVLSGVLLQGPAQSQVLQAGRRNRTRTCTKP